MSTANSYPLEKAKPKTMNSESDKIKNEKSTVTEGHVNHLKSRTEYTDLMKQEDGGQMIFKYSAVWCGPCQKIQPKFEQLAREYPKIKFYHVDVEESDLGDVASLNGVTNLPTFIFVENSKNKSRLVGASEKALEKWIMKCL